jgi:hypothetical protein
MNTSAGTSPRAQDKGFGNTASIAGRQEASIVCDLGNLLRGSGSHVRAANHFGVIRTMSNECTLIWDGWDLWDWAVDEILYATDANQ